jgi:hypothetical protein
MTFYKGLSIFHEREIFVDHLFTFQNVMDRSNLHFQRFLLYFQNTAEVGEAG